MKLLSLRAPWWWGVLHLGKDIENRDWLYAPSYRGPVLIHASATFIQKRVIADFEAMVAMNSDALRTGYATARPEPAMSLAALRSRGGHIVGRCELVGVVRQSKSPWFVGPLGFVLTEPVAFRRPIPFKAGLGLMDVPCEILEQLPEGA